MGIVSYVSGSNGFKVNYLLACGYPGHEGVTRHLIVGYQDLKGRKCRPGP